MANCALPGQPHPQPLPKGDGSRSVDRYYYPKFKGISVIYGVRRASHPPWGEPVPSECREVGGGVDKGGAICSIKNYNSSLMYHHKIIQLVGNREHLGEGMGA